MRSSQQKLRRAIASVLFVSASSMSVFPLLAAAADEEDIETVIVTGSNIRRADIETAARDGRDAGRQRERHLHEFRPLPAAAVQGRAEHLGDRHAQERRGRKGAVAHVLVEVAVPDQGDRVHVQQQGCRAAIGRGLRVVGVGRAERQRERSPRTCFVAASD